MLNSDANDKTLLIVEDNHILREGLRDILILEGFTILTASDGLEALAQMETLNPDLILSDIAMPGMDGIEFFQAVRSRPEWVTIPFLFLTARGEKEDILTGKNLGAEDYLVKPLTREELLTAVHSRLNRSHELQVAQLKQAYEASLTVMANAIDIRDPYTHGHVERVTEYAHVLAKQLGWDDSKLEQLRFGAILHDIGKIFIHEHTLFKDTPLSEVEWNEIYAHPQSGAEMIKDIPFLAPAVPIVRHHHERWDGQGYPDRLAGEEIPLEARIVAVADCFDAMTIDRPYRTAFSLDQAYQDIISQAGAQFDPQVVEAFQYAWEAGQLAPIWEAWQDHANGNGRQPTTGSPEPDLLVGSG